MKEKINGLKKENLISNFQHLASNHRGITLIALVITIIVMLILVAVTISMAVNGGLFEHAGKAARETEEEKNKELGWANIDGSMTTDDLIDKFVDQSVTNPYENETPTYTWTHVLREQEYEEDNYYEWIDREDETGDIIARAYPKGISTIDGEEKQIYHLVIEYLKGKGFVDDLGEPRDGMGAWHDFDGIITKAIVCDGITGLGNNAFRDCEYLEDVIITNTVTEIGANSFYNCSRLTNIKIPRKVEKIALYAFAYCTSLTNVVIPDSVTFLGSRAFQHCTNLKNVKMSNNITALNNNTFSDCVNLENIEISKNLHNIFGEVFYNCSSLKSLTLPGDVNFDGSHAFYNCIGLTELTACCTSSFGALNNYDDLKSLNKIVMLPSTSTDGNCFPKSNVKEIVVENGMKWIYSNSLGNYPKLEILTLPASITRIGFNAFGHDTMLERINYLGTMEQWNNIEKDLDWAKNSNLETIVCSDGEIAL